MGNYFANYLVLGGVAAVVALVAIWAGQSPRHWFIRGCVLGATLALFLPVQANEPLLYFLVIAPLISFPVAWLESRRNRKASNVEEQSHPRRTQFTLATLFLLFALLGMALGLGSTALRSLMLVDGRSLPISAMMFSVVVILSYRVAAFPGGLSHKWAVRIAIAFGLALSVWFCMRGVGGISMPVPESTALAVAYTSAVGALLAATALAVIGYVLLRFGSPVYLILLIAAMAMAAWLECDWLGDWMYVYDLLRMPRSPSGAAHISAIFLAYSFFAMTMILSVAAGRLAFSSSAPAWRKYPARAIVVAGVAGAAVGLASVYWRVIPISPREFAVSREVENPLEDALPLIDEFQSRNSRVVYARIVAKLQQPGRAPFDPQRDVHVESKRAQEAIQNKLLAFSYSLDADAKRGMHQKEFDSAVPYLIAKLQLGASLRRQGLLNQRASISAMLSNESVLKLHLIRNNISPESVRKICEALRQIELHREPFETSLQRDYAWEERATNWRARLRTTFDPDVPAGFQNGSQQWLRTMDGITVAMQRLLDTELAIHLFREKQGRLPQKLDELVPDYLDAVPLDPFSEQALVYRPENGSYLLYSVAPDGMDNQGRPGHLFEAFSYAPVDLDLDFFARPYSPSNRPILPAATKRRSPPP